MLRNKNKELCLNFIFWITLLFHIEGPLWLPEEDKTSNNDKPLTSDQTKTSKLTVVDVEQKLTETPASSIIVASAGDVVVQPKWVRPPRPPKKFVKYEVIGTNNVAVPSHLFKVIHNIHVVTGYP